MRPWPDRARPPGASGAWRSPPRRQRLAPRRQPRSGVVLAVSARIYTAHTQDRSCTVDCSGYDAGYKWAKQRDIVDDDYCPDGDKSFYEGCVAYAVGSSGAANETDNGIGTPPPLSNDDDNDDDN